jgi:hypothetical protein
MIPTALAAFRRENGIRATGWRRMPQRIVRARWMASPTATYGTSQR